MRTITARQRVVLDTICQHIDRHGYPPTLRWIGAATGIKSTNGVSDHLKALERKGYLATDAEKARGIRVLRKPGATEEPSTLAPKPPPIDRMTLLRERMVDLRRREDAVAERVAAWIEKEFSPLTDVSAILRDIRVGAWRGAMDVGP